MADLVAVPHDGKVHQVSVGDLGSYRVIATTTRTGQPSITALPTATMDATIQKFVLLEVALALGGLVIAGVVGSLLVRRSLAPLDRVADVAEHVSQLPLAEGEVGALHGVDPRDTDERTEVGKVGAALNRMLDNVGTSLAARHRSETQVRQFVADASHELRTPLASIRGYAELVRRSPSPCRTPPRVPSTGSSPRRRAWACSSTTSSCSRASTPDAPSTACPWTSPRSPSTP
ncbi:hypothetical protein GCM10025864_07480 [Luteimicrobium album]|uniref:histidine kinase n=1 Tax=Luteimicrobium album TaxID=1054550 RepID=A0ABQ6HWV6_9MICO|nr:histidine kinase dimerization/phospho-acceptor domain-containing protein [Luteimicrobium album]GMA22989.1 hypothetical protein GCM10025864_07480 [Luteimicrobium album]